MIGDDCLYMVKDGQANMGGILLRVEGDRQIMTTCSGISCRQLRNAAVPLRVSRVLAAEARRSKLIRYTIHHTSKSTPTAVKIGPELVLNVEVTRLRKRRGRGQMGQMVVLQRWHCRKQ